MNKWILAVVGVLVVFAGGYLVASWKGGRMPWESAPSQMSGRMPGPADLSGAFNIPPNQAPSSQGQTQSLPQTETQIPPVAGMPPVTASTPAAQGDLLFEQGRYQEAISHYRQAVAENPKDVDSWNDLGLALHYAGQGDEALKALRKGTEVEPLFQRVWLSLGFVAFQQQRLQEAKLALQRVLSIDPSSGIAQEAQKFLKRIP